MFTEPAGEPGLVAPDSLSASIYANPLSLAIGGIAAVILELAEPRVRHGVWDHSVFPSDPALRLRRTGLAAMVTFYGAKSTALGMIEGINRRHASIRGQTDAGVPYEASDPELLAWVQATAAYGFIEAHSRYVRPLSDDDWARALREAEPAARAYCVLDPPATKQEVLALIQRTTPRLEPSNTLDTFLHMMRTAPVLPRPARPLQPIMVAAAGHLLPVSIRTRLGLQQLRLSRLQRALVRSAVKGANLVRLRNHPRELAKRRLSARV